MLFVFLFLKSVQSVSSVVSWFFNLKSEIYNQQSFVSFVPFVVYGFTFGSK
jgi:hypothetical protein